MLPFLDAWLVWLEQEWWRCLSAPAISRGIPRASKVQARELTDMARMRLYTLAALYRVDLHSTEKPKNLPTPLWLLAGPAHQSRKRAIALRASVNAGLKTLQEMIKNCTEQHSTLVPRNEAAAPS